MDLLVKIDPDLLNKGLLDEQAVQERLAWATVRRLVDSLLEDLESEELDTRAQALSHLDRLIEPIHSLGKLDTLGRIIGVLLRDLESKEEDLDQCHALGKSLTQIGHSLVVHDQLHILQKLVLSLRRIAGEELPEDTIPVTREEVVRQIARTSLEKIAVPKVVDFLLGYMQSPHRRHSVMAVDTLYALATDTVVDRLIDVFQHPDRSFRNRAFKLLVDLGPRSAPQLIQWLQALHDTQVLPRLDRDELTDAGFYTIRNCLGILARMGVENIGDFVVMASQDSDPRIRKEALVVLLRNRLPNAGRMAEQLLMDRDERVVDAALRVVAALPEPSAPEALIQLFWSTPRLRHRIMDLLGRVGGKASHEFLTIILRGKDKKLNRIFLQDLELQRKVFRSMAQLETPEAAEELRRWLKRWRNPFKRLLLTPMKIALRNRELLDEAVHALAHIETRLRTR